ncbi:MAG TPA: DUF922 domain-containing protein, partial [Herpetosiphonaceae bacterium]
LGICVALAACSSSSRGGSSGSPAIDTAGGAELVDQNGRVSIPGAKITYYDISGDTEDELRSQLDRKAPVGYDGFKGDATTKWQVKWNWPGYGKASCTLAQADVDYEIEVIMPRWKAPSDADPALVAKWDRYVEGLAAHEKGHVDNVIKNHEQVTRAIADASCSTADGEAQQALDELREFDVTYDDQTEHGAEQGVRFP